MKSKFTFKSLNALIIKLKFRKLLLPIIGFLSLIWFLIRVIPKPDRATYPCQRAAFPLASAFVIWITGIIASVFVFKKAKLAFQKAKYLSAFMLLIVFSVFYIVLSPPEIVFGAMKTVNDFEPIDNPNEPVGTARGIHPGRVVWAYDEEATSWNGTDGVWFDNNNTDPNVVDTMFSNSLQSLTSEVDDGLAWNALFKHFNIKHGKTESGYQTGEKIAIKLNLITSPSHNELKANQYQPALQLILTIVTSLIEHSGVPETAITLYDASRYIPENIYLLCTSKYPGLTFVDKIGGDGRMKYETDTTCKVNWSEDLVIEADGGHQTYLPKCVSEADYLINIANLKGHTLAGVTMCAKNHVGTILSQNPEKTNLTPPLAAGLHPYIAAHYFESLDIQGRDMGTYNALVDLMGHKDLGEKTLLFMIDALYAPVTQQGKNSIPTKWESSPFNGDWPSSLFLSQDGVAIESVGLDFLRNEPSQNLVYGNVDNYLHEAAQADNPPSQTFYDPEGDASRLKSLGVHEHWNNPQDKQYSRNLDTGNGIELIKLDQDTTSQIATNVYNRSLTNDLKIFPNPASEHINLNLDNDLLGKFQLKITDQTGKTVYTATLEKQMPVFNTKIELNELANGFYILSINSKDYTTAKSFCKN